MNAEQEGNYRKERGEGVGGLGAIFFQFLFASLIGDNLLIFNRWIRIRLFQCRWRCPFVVHLIENYFIPRR